MTFLQRDKEGVLRPITRISIDRKIYDTACELTGTHIIGSLLESLAMQYINRKRKERDEDPFELERGDRS